MRIAIVGPCGAGKTTLANGLRALGYDANDCAQEHSQVQEMWSRIARPDVLLYLDAELPTIRSRLQVSWDQAYLDEMNRRLSDARTHADFRIVTDPLTRQEVLARAVEFLKSANHRK